MLVHKVGLEFCACLTKYNTADNAGDHLNTFCMKDDLLTFNTCEVPIN